MLSFIKTRTPERVKKLIKNSVQITHYTGLRFLSYFLFPFRGYQSPLRGYYISTKDLISDINGDYILLDNSEDINYSSYQKNYQNPSTESDKIDSDSCFISPETFVAVIPNGRVIYDYGVVVSPNHRLVGDVSINLGGDSSKHGVMFDPYLPPVQNIQGSLAVLSSTAHQRYFHWMFDVLPRFELLKRSQISIDTYLINCEKSFQRDSLEVLGIPKEKIINPQSNTHIQAELLIVPSLPGKISYMTRSSCNFLRSIFLNEPDDFEINRYLYITRGDALTRRVLNEDEVLIELTKYGFECITLEGTPIVEQAKLFASAKIIVAPHGAALTNIVFCQKNSLVIEFMPDTYIEPCFERLADLLSLRYKCLKAKTIRKTFTNSVEQTHDHYVDVSELNLLIQKYLN